MNIFNKGDWISIRLEDGTTKAFSKFNQKMVELENGDIEFEQNGVNENLKTEIDTFAGEGFYEANKDKLL